MWAAQRYQDEDVTPAEAPSSTAWSLVQWIRRSGEESFWSSTYGRLLPPRNQLVEEDDTAYERKMAAIFKELDEECWEKKREEFRADPRMEREVARELEKRP